MRRPPSIPYDPNSCHAKKDNFYSNRHSNARHRALFDKKIVFFETNKTTYECIKNEQTPDDGGLGWFFISFLHFIRGRNRGCPWRLEAHLPH